MISAGVSDIHEGQRYSAGTHGNSALLLNNLRGSQESLTRVNEYHLGSANIERNQRVPAGVIRNRVGLVISTSITWKSSVVIKQLTR